MSPDGISLRRRALLGALGSGGVLTGAAYAMRGRGNDAEPSAESQHLSPGTYAMIVIFRNDDPAPGNEPNAFADVNAVFRAEGVPVSHGVIPRSPGATAESDGPFCARLRERADANPGLIEYALHGDTHRAETDFHGASEFGGLDPDEQRDRIEAGLDRLASCTGRPADTFIPPFDTYDEDTATAVGEVGMTVLSGGDWFVEDYYDEDDIPFESNGVLHVPRMGAFVRDWDTNTFYRLDTMTATFDEVYASGDLYVQMLHHQHFTSDARLAQLRAFIQHVTARASVGCMTMGAFGRAYRAGDLQRVEDGWRYDPA